MNLWIKKPEQLKNHFMVMLPIVASQVLQRLYPVVDNHYLSTFGNEVLYVHGIQYNFITFGQFIGLATYMSCLVFWRRQEYLGKQGGILVSHLLMSGLFSVLLAIFSWIFTPSILAYYKISQAYMPMAKTYLRIGLCSMVLQAIYGGLDGMLVSSQKQKISMCIAVFLLAGNIIVDKYIVFSNVFLEETVKFYTPVCLVGFSTAVLLFLGVIVSLIIVCRSIQSWDWISWREMLSVWWSELGSYLMRGAVPFIYAYQLCFISTSSRLLVTYQLALHVSYLICFPLIAAMQVAVRDAGGKEDSCNIAKVGEPPAWWGSYFYTGMIPSVLLILLVMFVSSPILKILYGYTTPNDHSSFLFIFFFSCLIGQIGNTFTIPLRAARKSYFITKNFFLSELVVMLGGTQLLIYTNEATPQSLGYIILLFTICYCGLNFRDIFKLKIR